MYSQLASNENISSQIVSNAWIQIQLLVEPALMRSKAQYCMGRQPSGHAS